MTYMTKTQKILASYKSYSPSFLSTFIFYHSQLASYVFKEIFFSWNLQNKEYLLAIFEDVLTFLIFFLLKCYLHLIRNVFLNSPGLTSLPPKTYLHHIGILSNIVTLIQEVSRNILKISCLIYKLVLLFPFISNYLKNYARVTTQSNAYNTEESKIVMQ